MRQLVPGAFLLAFASFLVAGLLEPVILWGAGLLLASYLAVSFASATALCHRHIRWDLLPLMPPVFAVYHFGFGWGYLRGVADFLLLKRTPAAAMVLLTRTPQA